MSILMKEEQRLKESLKDVGGKFREGFRLEKIMYHLENLIRTYGLDATVIINRTCLENVLPHGILVKKTNIDGYMKYESVKVNVKQCVKGKENGLVFTKRLFDNEEKMSVKKMYDHLYPYLKTNPQIIITITDTVIHTSNLNVVKPTLLLNDVFNEIDPPTKICSVMNNLCELKNLEDITNPTFLQLFKSMLIETNKEEIVYFFDREHFYSKEQLIEMYPIFEYNINSIYSNNNNSIYNNSYNNRRNNLLRLFNQDEECGYLFNALLKFDDFDESFRGEHVDLITVILRKFKKNE